MEELERLQKTLLALYIRRDDLRHTLDVCEQQINRHRQMLEQIGQEAVAARPAVIPGGKDPEEA